MGSLMSYLDQTAPFFTLVGFLTTIFLVKDIGVLGLRCFYIYLLARFCRLGVNLKKMGQWAVVTGASDGIGKEYARELARFGLDIILISRNYDKLLSVAQEIKKDFNVKTKIIVADFSEGSTSGVYDRIKVELNSFEIGVLVNNVGMFYEYPEYFASLPKPNVICPNLINVNIIAATMLTQIILPQMVSRCKGVIVNMSSIVGLVPVPLMTLYSACKAFNEFFSRALCEEYKTKGIIIQTVNAGCVNTKLSKTMIGQKEEYFSTSPENFVRSAIKTIGVMKQTNGYWKHELVGWFLQRCPDSWLMSYCKWAMLSQREKYLKNH